ncbi:AlpA family transcriptional regulator [Actinokineospora sp. UTMC 2448]|uniref:helix-turn-helix transcriptional regulator n=1 Tax=Actinokineospora sp. UTMC 2448 TaxID=2268449 RepID=UPI002164B6AE|nr:helix-turn-helix domain-containing protein [Actinokineospora sp. UTMC 2448]UVS78368.1 Helix-turn-helix domain protein [Actinokineospora sp. UTMC 2448]
MSKLWGPKELAEFLGVPLQTIYQWRSKRYGPPGRRIGKYVKFRPEDVYAWVDSQPGAV